MRIDGDGFVGIGTSTPQDELHVSGTGVVIRATGTNAAFNIIPNANEYSLCEIGESERATLRFGIENTDGGAIMTGSLANASVITSRYDSPLQIGTDITPRITITTDGNITMPDVYYDTVGATYRDLYIGSDGRLGYLSSSSKYKVQIRDIKRTIPKRNNTGLSPKNWQQCFHMQFPTT